MDFSINEDQQAVVQLAGQILQGEVTADYLHAVEAQGQRFDPRLWQKLAEAGLLGVSIDEAHGGMGFDFEALCLLIEEAGKTLPPVPLIPVLTAAMTLQQYAAAEQRERWLPGIAAGNLLVTTALSEPASDDPCTPSAGLQASGEGWLLFGCKHMVVAADQADAMLLSARFGNELVLLAVATTAVGISVVAQEVTTGEPQFTVTFDSVRVSRSDIIARGADAHCALESLVQHTLVASACMTLGVTETMLRLTAGYTAEREQFGRPIATFQAVSHRAADAFIDVENLRLACQQAASLLSKQSDATQAVMIAKIWASDVAHRVSQSSQHLHGGIGVDRDYPLFRYCLWAKQLELTLGGGNAYLMRLGDAIAQEFTRRAAKPLLDSNAA